LTSTEGLAGGRSKARRISLAVIQGAVSIGLIWAILATVDRAAMLSVVQTLSVGAFLVAVVGVLLIAVLQAIRWQWILAVLGGRIGSRRSVGAVFLGLFFNQALPSTVGGDVARMWVARDAGPRVSTAIHSVFVDRVVGLVVLALIASLWWPFLVARIGWQASTASSGVISVGGLVVTILFLSLLALPSRARSLPLLRQVTDLAAALWVTVRPGRRLLAIFALAAAGHFGILGLVIFLGHELEITLAWQDYFLVIPAILIVSVAPLSIGGWGVREGAMVVGLGLLGVPSESALGLSLVFGAVSLVAGLLGGGFWFVLRSDSPADRGSANGE